jgi:hypothetical protein
VITCNLFASGLPNDGHSVLGVLNIGSDPRATTDAYLNEAGKVVNILADPAHHTAEDPVNLKVFGRKGEPIQLALVSDDDLLITIIRALSYRLCPSPSKRPWDRAT